MATYYVDYVGGDDTDNGTSDSTPWQHCPGDANATSVPAAATIAEGDTVLFKGGVEYNGSIDIVGSNGWEDGAVGNYTTILSGHLHGTPWGTGRAILDGNAIVDDGTGDYTYGFWINSVDYIRIEGMQISNLANGSIGAGIATENTTQYCQFVNNLIYNVYGQSGENGYGISLGGSSDIGGHLAECNIIYNTEEKDMECYRVRENIIRYNYLGATHDHCLALNSSDNEVYGNIFHNAGHNWWPYLSSRRPAYGVKADSGTTVFADGNKIYNNLIWDCLCGIGILNGQDNEIHHNTVYYTGFEYTPSSGGSEGAGFGIYDDGTAGTHYCSGNVVKNNIFYWSQHKDSDKLGSIFWETDNLGDNNVISNNLIYGRDGAYSGEFCKKVSTVYTWDNLSTFETDFSAYGSGNLAENNVVADAGLVGGTGTAALTSCPDGLTSEWVPNDDGLEIAAGSGAHNIGAVLGSPYDSDILGVSRPQGAASDAGAYEVEEGVRMAESITVRF